MVVQESRLKSPSSNNYTTTIDNYYLDVLKNYQRPLKERKYPFLDGVDGSPAYTAFLNWLQSPKTDFNDPYVNNASRPSWGCLVVGKEYSCKDHGSVYKPDLCGMPKFCVVCGENYTKSRVGSIMRLFNMLSEKIPDLYLQSVVFTLPPHLQSLVSHKNFKKFQLLCKSVLEEYHNGVKLAGFQTVHTWHSDNPLGVGTHISIHFGLTFSYDKAQAQFTRVDHYLDVKRLNALYKKALSSFFGQEVRSVNLRVHYDPFTEETRPKIYHHLKYALRMYQFDLVKFSNYNQISRYTDEERNNVVLHLLPPRHWRRSQWFGWRDDGEGQGDRIPGRDCPEEGGRGV